MKPIFQTILITAAIAIGFVVGAYSCIRIFIWKNASAMDYYISVIFLAILWLGLTTLVINKLAEKFPNSKSIKLIKKCWSKVSDLFSTAISGM